MTYRRKILVDGQWVPGHEPPLRPIYRVNLTAGPALDVRADNAEMASRAVAYAQPAAPAAYPRTGTVQMLEPAVGPVEDVSVELEIALIARLT